MPLRFSVAHTWGLFSSRFHTMLCQYKTTTPHTFHISILTVTRLEKLSECLTNASTQKLAAVLVCDLLQLLR
jgi:hypothetical protein